MVAALSVRGSFFREDDRGVDFVHVVDEGNVFVQSFDDEDAGTGKEDVIPFILEGIEGFKYRELARKIVNGYGRDNCGGEGVMLSSDMPGA